MNVFMGNLDEAEAKYKQALALKPDFYGSCEGLAYIYALKEDYKEAARWQAEFIKRAPTPQYKMMGLFLKNFFDHFLGRLDRSLAGLISLRSQAENFKFPLGLAATNRLMGRLYADLGEFDKARKAFQGWMEYNEKSAPADRPAYAAGHSLDLGWVDLNEGRMEAVRARLEEAEKLLPGLKPVDQGPITLRYLILGAEAALAGNSIERAISIGEKIAFEPLPSVSVPEMIPYNFPLLKDVLARAYWKKGDLDKAVAEYERLTTIDPKNRFRMLIHPLYHYRFGRVLEQKGDKGRARLEYEKFLKYWADADPRFAELKDARARLAALKRIP